MKNKNDEVVTKDYFDKSIEKLLISVKNEIHLANSDLEKNLVNTLENTEKALSTRITTVADLITIELGTKINDHEKRIKHLEHTTQTT
jgi:hypothetical protein